MVSVPPLLVLSKHDSVSHKVAQSAGLFLVYESQMTLEAGHRGADKVADFTPEPARPHLVDVGNHLGWPHR